MAINYKSCLQQQEMKNEHNDCSVKAIAIATNQPYIKAHTVLQKLGRKNRKGCMPRQILSSIRVMGFSYKDCGRLAKTVTTLEAAVSPSKRYICFVRGHVLAIVNGKIEDWTEGRRYRVQTVIEVTPNKSKNAIRKAERYSK
mgnify:FL=1|tara:strand:- start:2689 stop:3114 length:426 start_codon:yes stop_codon:yes gene_type:complete